MAKTAALRAALRGVLTGSLAPEGRLIGYHGSPKRFDRFDSSFMGSGEGAQSWGYGHYIAEHPKVGDEYREKLSDALAHSSYAYDGNVYERGSPEWKMLATIHNGSMGEARQILDWWKRDAAEPYMADNLAKMPDFIERAEAIIGRNPTRRQIENRLGALYEVDIPDSPYVDWDAPLEKQPDAAALVREGLKREGFLGAKENGPRQFAGALRTWNMYNGGFASSPTESVLQGRGNLLGKTPQEAASNLRDAGYKGFKFLDAGSRTKERGKRTRNYVIFGDDDINIRAVKGLALALGGAGGAEALRRALAERQGQDA